MLKISIASSWSFSCISVLEYMHNIGFGNKSNEERFRKQVYVDGIREEYKKNGQIGGGGGGEG